MKDVTYLFTVKLFMKIVIYADLLNFICLSLYVAVIVGRANLEAYKLK